MTFQQVKFVKKPTVRLLDSMGDDTDICSAARVSTVGEDETVKSIEDNQKLIAYLMKNRHGSPFEHTAIKMLVKAPLVVWAQHDKHRIGVSRNSESGRYRELQAEFLVPNARTQVGKPGHYRITEAPSLQWVTDGAYKRICRAAWSEYQDMLKLGVAREVARGVLPQTVMATSYITMNVRSMLHFLSLRVDHPDATFASHPMREIQDVAERYEQILTELFPFTVVEFNRFGRVAP